MSAPPSSRSPLRLGILVVLVLVGGTALATAAYTGRFDGTPPELRWEGADLTATVSGTLAAGIEVFDERPGLRVLQVRVDGSPLPVAPDAARPDLHSGTLDTASLPDGAHELTVVARDRSWRRNVAELSLSFHTDNTPAELSLASGSRSVGQGATLALFVRASEELVSLQASLLDREVEFHPLGDGHLHRALVGVGVKQEAGEQPVELRATDAAGNITRRGFALTVDEVDFPLGGYVNLNAKQQKAQKDRSKAKEANAKRREAYGNQGPDPLWTGAFLRPAEGRVTSQFGRYRQYSSGIRSHHLGIDIANTLGTPIRAAAPGVVTLAEELHIYGNAVILSHGQGISTSYNHLSAIDVEVGQRVDAGQVVGRMGSTGQSTGSHLHWGMVVAGMAVDPGEWTDAAFDVGEAGEFTPLEDSPAAQEAASVE